MGLGLACLCLLAFTAIAGTGTAAAAECPNEAIRIAQGATRLPDCRAYERVSPTDSAGGVVGVDSLNKPLFAAMRADGNAADFGSSSSVGETERGALTTANLARRTAEGWKSFSVVTTTEPSVPLDLSMSPASPTPSADMSRVMFRASRTLGPPNPVTSGGSVYLSAPGGKGAPTWLTRWYREGVQPNPTPGLMPLGGSPDFSSGYFRYSTPLTNVAGDNLRTGPGLYYFEGETIKPAGVLPSGLVSPQGAIPAGTGSGTTDNGLSTILPEQAKNQVSVVGPKLFFVSPAGFGELKQLYVQEGGKPGRLISHDTAGNPAAGGIFSLGGNSSQLVSDEFAAATPDGSRVVFRSEAALTVDAPASGVKTYRAEITPGAITLTYLPAVDGSVLQIDGDASTILFSVPGSAPGQNSYYVWDEGRPAAPYTVQTDVSGSNQMPEVVFSADGSALVFTSGAEFEPGIPGNGATQIYRWTRQGQTVTCISCRRDGGTPGAFGSHIANSPSIATDNPAYPGGIGSDPANQSTVVGNRKISSDGSRVFFDTNDPLDPVHDVNGVRDVYMWENGKNYLLTTGRGGTPSLILDNGESGNDVMFVTKDALVPSDTNQTYDVYDARVDGGFAEPKVEVCEGEACQASRSAPASSPPASRSVRGVGNVKSVSLGAVKIAQMGKPGKIARVRVSVPAAGHLKLGGGLLNGKSRSVKAKGAVKLNLTLTKAGKRKLAAKGQLRTKVTATFRDSNGGTKKNSVTLRFKQGGHR